jgi:hypothetical protein
MGKGRRPANWLLGNKSERSTDATEEEIKRLFSKLDADGSHFLDMSELKEIVRKFSGDEFVAQDFLFWYDEHGLSADKPLDGKLDLAEFGGFLKDLSWYGRLGSAEGGELAAVIEQMTELLPQPPATAKSIWYAAMRGDARELAGVLARIPPWQLLADSAEHPHGTTPLMMAARKSAECVRLLVAGSEDVPAANVGAVDDTGATVLHHAVRGRRMECIFAVLEAGAAPSVRGGALNLTPRGLALHLGFTEVADK